MKKVLPLMLAVLAIFSLFVFGHPKPAQAGQYLYEVGSTGANITVSTCTGCRVVNVKNIPNVIANDNIADNSALSTYMQSNKTNIVYFFPQGTYNFSSRLSLDQASNIAFVGEKGAILKKNGTLNSGLILDGSANDVSSGYSGEYILYFTRGSGITVSGLHLEGLTTTTTDFDFGEQGIYLGSCNRSLVENNEFYNFGDGAIRSATYPGDPNGTVGAFNTRIRNNYFYNIFQITSTPNDSPVNGVGRGGTQNFVIEDNFIENLKGSVKICARHETHGARVRGNTIQLQQSIDTSVGVEMCSVSDILISGNLIKNAGQWGMTYYVNGGGSIEPLNGWPWNNLVITGNIIMDSYRGIRLSNGAYDGDGYISPTKGILIANNSLYNITGPNHAINVSNTYGGGLIANNVCSNITSGTCVSSTSGTGLTSSNNILN